MEEVSILRDIIIIFSVSVVVVFVFQKIHLPSIAGFLVAGTLVGPYGLNLISDREQVQVLAELGVILLLFTIGLEFSLSNLKSIQSLLFIAGPVQVLAVLGLVVLGGIGLGFELKSAIFWGMLLSLSSTAIVLKALSDRRENETLHGHSTIGVLIFQDLAVVPMMLMTPFLGEGGGDGRVADILWTLAESLALVIGVVIAARYAVPKLLMHIVRTRSRELFLLTVVVLGLGTAWITSHAGLSLALGAFIAGLLISESEYSHQALAEVIPFRDSFNSLFFVSMGMLMDPRVLVEHPFLIMLIVVTVYLGKFLTAAGAVVAAGVPLRSAVLAGVALAQVGEFSFILAQEGIKVGILYRDTYNIFLAVSVITMIITPFAIQWSPKIARRTEALQRLHQWLPGRITHRPDSVPLKLKDHVIIVGYGVNGRNLAKVLGEFQLPYVVLEIRGDVVQMALGSGVPIQYGDATNPTVLKQAHIDFAKVLVVATSDPFSTRRIVQMGRALNPDVHIVVRTRYLKELEELSQLGANEIVPEEFETSIEISTLVLQAYQMPKQAIIEKAETIRREGYALLRRGEVPEMVHRLRAGPLVDVEVETCRIDEDSPALGKSLAELGIRKRTGVSVVALTRGGVTQANPPNKTVLEVGDVLSLLGTRENVRKTMSLLAEITPR